ncbi:uncharacterized protein LOC106740187 isoform X2 [Alligator mississippiensis]|uniref:uncharacterized protein LOC106740187 isoform X2 n=1 Tax=Alligator mississippiensis TaxID=8496 RepID=UPI0028779704|nr:uncharacterized protein LOC106740187 isoform X2 [Alligator mississippiensis]
MGVWDENLGPFLLPVVVLLSSLFAPDGPKLQVTTVPSSWARLGSGAQLQCRFTVGSPVVLRSLRVQWYLGEQKMAWYDQGRSRVQPGASLPSEKELQSGDASLSLATVTPWDKGMYKCVVWHREHQHQGETTLHLLVGPRVSIPRQPAVANAKTSLLCHMAGFFPVDVDLAWLRDGQVLEGSTRSNSQKNLDGIFSLTLTYTFTPVISDIGSVFSCRVRHAALGQSLKEDVRLDIVAAPKISIPRQPVTADVETSLLCHVAGFFPSDVDVAWLRDGQVLKGSTRSSPQRNLDGTFSLTLTYTFTPARGDAGRVFSCCVHHAALEQSLQEDVSLVILVHTTEVDEISTLIGPILGILVVMVAAVATILSRCTNRSKGWAVPYSFSEVQVPEQCLLGQEVILHCSMEGTFPEDVAVTWERICSEDRTVPESAGDQESPEHQQLLPALPPGWRVTMQRAGTCLTSSLTFTPTVQDDGVRVRCCFLHETKCIREERVSPEIQVWARPQVSEIQVLPEWDPRDKVPFAVQLHNFYPREVPPIQWGWDGAGSWREDPAQIDKNADGTFTATSVWRVPSRSLTRPELRVQVCVQHGPGEPPSERELSLRATGLLRPPEVSEISQPKSMATGKGVTLSCRIAGHFPGELSVTWLRRRKGEATAVILRDSAECRVEPGTAVLARDGKSFQQETRLTHWTSRDQGAEYICRVGHLTLETHIERNSGCHPPPPDLGEVFRPQAPVSGEPMTLKGLLSQFYPKQLAMTWLQKRERRKEPRPLESSPPPQHRTHTPSRVPDRKSYSVDSELSLPTVGTEDGVTDYQCHVEHEALKKPKSSRKLRLKGLMKERFGTHITSYMTFMPMVQDKGLVIWCCFLHDVKQIRKEQVSLEIRVWGVDLTGAQLESSWDPDRSGSHGCQKHFLLYEEERPSQADPCPACCSDPRLGRCWSDACWPRR